MTRTLLGYAVTNSNGVGSLTYTGQGVGEMEVTAETGGEVLFHYFGVGGTETDFWTGQTGNNAVSQSSSATGTTFTSTGSATGFIWANLQGQTPSTLEGIFTGDMTVEFDVVSVTGSVQFTFYEPYASGVTVNSQRLELSTGHWKIERNGDVFTVDHDGTTSTATKVLTDPLRVGFVIASGKAVTFKNFFIYRDVYDAYDEGTSTHHDDIWTVPSNMILTRLSEYSKITESNTTNAEIYTTIPNNTTIEFDFKQVDGLANNYFFNLRTTGNSYKGGDSLNNVNGALNTWYHIKIVLNNGTCTIYNGANSHSTTYDISDVNLRFGFNMSGDATEYHFKNFKVYKGTLPLTSTPYSLLDCTVYDDMETTQYETKYKRDNTATISYSTDWAVNGSRSMKWDKVANASGNALYWGIVFISNPTSTAFDIDQIKGHMLQFKVTTKTTTSTSSENFTINSYVKTTTNTSWAGVGTAQTVQTGENTYTINYQIPDNATQWWLRFGQNGSGAKVLYVDNWKLYPIS